ncbi:MAG: DJ-1/PfpI family protein [Thermotogota bacterium]
MKLCIFYYDNFCEFETVMTSAVFSKEGVITVALEDRIYESSEKQRYLPHKKLNEIEMDEFDIFFIPGGYPDDLFKKEELINFIKKAYSEDKTIAGICGGTALIAKTGLLDGKKCTGMTYGLKDVPEYAEIFKNCIIDDSKDVVDSENIITSKGTAFVELALYLGKKNNVYKSEEEYQEDYKLFKNIK